MLTKPLGELEYERTLSIGVTYVPAYAGEAVGFGGNLTSVRAGFKDLPLTDMML